jgi:sugar-phosphatase
MPGAEALLAGRRLFIFDLDGTLADTSPIHAAAFSAAFGAPVDYPSIAGLTTAAAMRILLAQAGRDADDATVAALVAAKRAAARAGLASVREIAGAGAFVARAAATHKLALCTSGARATVDGTLARLGLAGRFDVEVTAEDMTRAKPAPDGFLTVLDRAGIAAGDALVFEDSDAGLAAAHAAGIDAIRIGPGGSEWPDLTAALAGVTA